MNKFFYLIALVVGGFLMLQVHQGRIGVNDVSGLLVSDTERSVEAEDTVRAMLFSSDPAQAAVRRQMLYDLAKSQKVSEFVVVAEDESALSEAEEIVGADLALIFPKAGAVFLPAERFVPKIKTFGQKSVVIGMLDFPGGTSEEVLAFQNETAVGVIEALDIRGVSSLNLNSPLTLGAVLQFGRLLPGYTKMQSPASALLYEGKREESVRPVTILAFGDMMLGRYVRTLMERHGHDYIFEKIRGENNAFFRGADIVFGNLEGPIKGKGHRSDTGMVFGFHEDTADLLKRYGFTLLSLANNHAVDQGWDGRDTTIAALEKAELGWCGHPSTPEAESVYYASFGEESGSAARVAFVCLHDVTFPLDDNAAVRVIEEVRERVDYLVVSVHWGYEYNHTPDYGTQVEPGRRFVDAGADLVIGHHPHVVQSFEEYKGKLIFYSLGNFVFDQYWSTETQEELAIGLVLARDTLGNLKSRVHLFPMKSERSQSRLMSGTEKAAWIEEFIGYATYSHELQEMIRRGVVEAGL